MTCVVLDAGALIALERNDRAMWAVLAVTSAAGGEVIVPSAAVAQAWRGSAGQAMLARALRQCVIASFDAVARDIGQLCARTRTRDVCDAHVAIVAATHGGILYTSDPADLATLITACRRRRPRIVRC